MKLREAAASPNKTEIQSPDGGLVASINHEGAYLESISAPDGRDLLFPRQIIDGKVRGGIPVCAPIFGPGDKVGLGQHGFARDLQWEKESEVGQSLSVARFILKNPAASRMELRTSPYAGCRMSLAVGLENTNDISILRMGLSISNEGEESFIVTPGFHPYFPMEGYKKDTISIKNDKNISEFSIFNLKEAATLPQNQYGYLEFSTDQHDVSIICDNLPVPVLWTDNPEKYLCVEPTRAGAITAPNANLPPNTHSLDPGASRHYAMRIEWAPKAEA